MSRLLHSKLNELEIRAQARLRLEATESLQLVRILTAEELLKLVQNLRDEILMPELQEIIDADVQAGHWPDLNSMSEDGRRLFFENMIFACEGRIEEGAEDVSNEDFIRYLDNPV